MNDIGSMLADLTDELDAMLQLERNKCFSKKNFNFKTFYDNWVKKLNLNGIKMLKLNCEKDLTLKGTIDVISVEPSSIKELLT